jgi:hypothetical protein
MMANIYHVTKKPNGAIDAQVFRVQIELLSNSHQNLPKYAVL